MDLNGLYKAIYLVSHKMGPWYNIYIYVIYIEDPVISEGPYLLPTSDLLCIYFFGSSNGPCFCWVHNLSTARSDFRPGRSWAKNSFHMVVKAWWCLECVLFHHFLQNSEWILWTFFEHQFYDVPWDLQMFECIFNLGTWPPKSLNYCWCMFLPTHYI